jgi:phasin
MTTASTAKATKNGKSSSTPFEAFTFPTPSFEVPAAFRDFAEKSVSQARDAYARIKTATEDATGVVENTFETVREGAFAIGVKALDAAQANADASFAFARDLFGVKTFSEVIELQSTFARKQFEAVTSQVKELQELGEKFIAKTSKPVTDTVEKTFKEMKVA